MKYDKLKFIYLIVIVIIYTTKAQAQFYFTASDTNFYEMVQRFQSDSLNTQDTSEGGFAAEFRRFANYWGPRVAPSGSFKIAGEAIQNYMQSHFNNTSLRLSSNYMDNWHPLGPIKVPSGIGRMVRLAIDPDNPTTGVYACAWNGGLWGGQWDNISSLYNWTPLSDNTNTVGSGDVAIISTDIGSEHHKFTFICLEPNSTAYFAPELGLGVYRFDDVGYGSWQFASNGMIGSGSGEFTNVNIWRLLPDPDPAKVGQLYAATDEGVFKTSNATIPDPGASNVTWALLSSLQSISQPNEHFRGLAFKPGNPAVSVVYASGKDVYRSVDEGSTWTSLGLYTKLGSPANDWVNIEVTQNGSANALYAHVFIYDNGVQEIWKFDDVANHTNPWTNLRSIPCGYGCSPGHLAITVPNDDMIYAGTDDLDRGTTTDGINWTFSVVPGSYSSQLHGDIHDLKFDGNIPPKLLIACDGGVYKGVNALDPNTYPTLSEANNNLEVGTILGMGTSLTDPDVIIAGMTDDGDVYTNNATQPLDSWRVVGEGGDGSQCLVDNVNPQIMYSTIIPSGAGRNNPSSFYYTNDGWVHQNDIGQVSSNYGNIAWKHRIGPKDDALYSAVNDIWKWDPINGWQPSGRRSNFTSSSEFGPGSSQVDFPSPCGVFLASIAFAPSNQNYIYAAAQSVSCPPGASYLLKSTSGGDGQGGQCVCQSCSAAPCWSDLKLIVSITGFKAFISDVAVSATDPTHVYFTCSGYVPGQKVYESTDGGTTWNNISSGIDDNLPVNCIAYEKGSNDGIYIGTDDGVYYKNKLMSSFQPFFQNHLPHTIVAALEINYANNVIRAGTFGRGVWESPLICPDEVDASNNNLNLNSLVGTSPEFDESTGTLTASTITIPVSRKVTYRATSEVDILPGFDALPGSDFRAFIHGCDVPGNSNPLRKSNPQSSPSYPQTTNSISTDLFTVYPNPNAGTFHLSMISKDQTIKDISIYDMFGKQVYQNPKTIQSDLDFDISKNAKGVYLVKVVNDGKVSVSRVVFM